MYIYHVSFTCVESDHTWKPNSPAPPEEPSYHPVQRMYVHPHSPSNGESWNKNRVYFRKMKLSNHVHNEREKVNMFIC